MSTSRNNIDPAKEGRKSYFFLDNYITEEKKKILINGVEYEITLFQKDHSNEYLLSEMKDGKVEGRCQLFNRGILSLAWTVSNGKRVGGVTEYVNGKAIQKESWSSLLGNGDRRRIENKIGGMKLVISCETEGGSGETVIYRGGFDEEMNRYGYGIEYDMESGKEKYEGYWGKDKLVHIMREFDFANNKMIEYADNNNNNNNNSNNKNNNGNSNMCYHNVDVLNRIPIYIGGYRSENGKFIRDGVGYLIDESTGVAIRESEWENGKEKKNGVELYEGWYAEGIKESIRSVLNNKNPEEMKNEAVEAVPLRRVKVRTKKDLNEIDVKVTDLVISSESCNSVNALNLTKFEWLQSIEIRDNCFETAKTFTIDGLKRLKKLKIGCNSFTQSTDTYGKDLSKSFHVLNCESLESIEIGEYSFSDFAGQFELKNLPSLRTIKIGGSDKGWNFAYSSFVVNGW